MGLGIIFVGMSYMSDALDSLVEIPWVADLLTTMGQYPWIGILVGIVTTSITQSSTAVTSMVVAMGMSEVITLEGAIGIILGANIGSCITGLIAALRLSSIARQVSFAQILINVFGVLLFMPFIPQFANFVERTSPDLPRQIANAHTIFNVSVSLLLFPFVRQIADIAKRLAPADPTKGKQKVTMYIDEMQYAVPAVALTEASRELYRLGQVTAEMVELSCQALIEKDEANAERVLVMEDKVVDPVTRELDQFVNQLMGAELTQTQHKRVIQIKSLLVDIERVGDMAEDIAIYAQDRIMANIPFSSDAIDELSQLSRSACSIYCQSLQAFQEENPTLAAQVIEAESEFDVLYWKTRETHIRRVEAGRCHPEAAVIFTEILRLLERISDHADNLGVSVSRNLNHTEPT
jgi:phosphate:Na+ symporter